MRQGLALILAVLLLAVSSYGWLQGRLELKAAYASNAALERRAVASEELLVRRTAIALEHQKKQQVFNKEIQDAIKEEPVWSSTAVPTGIATGLCKRLQCSTERSVQAP